MLHGIRLHAHVWDDFCRRHRHEINILCLDARGHGDSAWHPEGHYELQDHCQDLHAVLEARGLRKISLIGHSMGGRTCMLFAARYPEQVEQLVLADMGAGLPASLVQQDFSRITQTPPPQDFGSTQEAEDYLGRILSRASAEMIHETVIHGMRELPGGRLTWKYDPQLKARTGARHPDVDLWKEIGRIPCPTLLLHGEHSQVVSPEIAQRMAEEMADCRAVQIDDAGHALFTEQPKTFAGEVSEFLLNHSARH